MIWAFRALMLALVVLTVGWKLAAPRRPEFVDAAAALAHVLDGRLAGPIRVQPWGPNDRVFSAPLRGCALPLVVVPITASFSAAPALTQFHRPQARQRFVYLDWTTLSPDRWGLLRRQLRERVRALADVSPYAGRQTMLFVDEPTACPSTGSIVWAAYWLPQK